MAHIEEAYQVRTCAMVHITRILGEDMCHGPHNKEAYQVRTGAVVHMTRRLIR
jgi:hypothetical protein